jgi:hypothetical protein
MKKFYFFIVAILVTSTMFAQTIKNNPFSLVSKDGTKIEKPVAISQEKGIKATYITQGFDTSPLEWEQQNTHPTQRWFSGNPTGDPFSNVEPTNISSALFGYINEDCNEIIYSEVFDATGSTNLQLSFYCGYSGPWMIGGSQAGSNGADVRAVISTDGGTNWTQLWSYVETHNGTESWAWELVEINLQATYGGNPNLMIGFQYYGNDGDLGAIDAVVVKDYVAPTSPDLTVRATPQQALTPIAHATYALQANVKNVGSDLTTPQTLQISVTPGTYTDAITIPLPFVTNADSTFTSSNYFTASAIGTYTANFEVAMAGDPTPENNTSTTSFQVTEHTFGTDNGIIVDGGGGNTPLTFGNIYLLMNEDVIDSYTIGWPQITENLDFTVSIYSINTTTFELTEVYTSETFTRTVAMSDTFADFDIENQTLPAGLYFFAVNQLTATNIAVGVDGLPSGLVYVLDGTQLGSTSVLGNVAIRVNTTGTTGVEENLASNISVYPNPANDFVTVANAENANIVIVNMLGEVVANVNNASSNQNIDISKLANGTYFVKVDGEVFKINVVK